MMATANKSAIEGTPTLAPTELKTGMAIVVDNEAAEDCAPEAVTLTIVTDVGMLPEDDPAGVDTSTDGCVPDGSVTGGGTVVGGDTTEVLETETTGMVGMLVKMLVLVVGILTTGGGAILGVGTTAP